jgi:hypothetical protein
VSRLFVLLLGVALGCSSAPIPGGPEGGPEAGTDGGGEAGADSGGDAARSCPSDLPASCPGIKPSYHRDVVPILSAACIHCHSPTGIGGYSETTYADVYQQRSAILDQVYSCLMPPASRYGGLTIGQRETLLAWLVCGAPEN